MCGICGLLSNKALKDEDYKAVNNMISALTHRGPDSHGLAQLPCLLLGGTRLAILDVEANNTQPIQSANERFIMVFNGEIYNFLELRQHLKHKGHAFRTSTDSEVLLEYLALYGKKALKDLNGMFSFALWDKMKKSLLIARDRFGQKPLYYTKIDNKLLFSSEIMPLFSHPCVSRTANLNAIFHYLTIQSIPDPFSAFSNIYKLPPGHFMEISHDLQFKLEAYWHADNITSFQGNAEEAEEELNYLLKNAVQRHLISNVPLGIFLSGGVDSSLITALASKEQLRIQTFAMGFDEQSHDERAFAKKVAMHCNTNHHELSTKYSLPDLLPKIIQHFGEPFADSSVIPTWLLCQAVRKQVTVALSGDGGDDLFSGYARYVPAMLYARDNSYEPNTLKMHKNLLDSVGVYVPQDMLTKLSPALSRYFYYWATFADARKYSICKKDTLSHVNPSTTLQFLLQQFAYKPNNCEADNIRLFELKYYLASTLLPKIDISAMASSLEVRAPFLDSHVAEFAISLPVQLRLYTHKDKTKGSLSNGIETKWLLKKLASRYLTKSIVYRKKQGFGIPLNKWLKNQFKEMLCDTLLTGQPTIYEWVKKDEVQKLVYEHLHEKNEHSYRIWALFMLEIWSKYCLKG